VFVRLGLPTIGTENTERIKPSAEGATIEAPRRRVGSKEGLLPPQWGWVCGGAVPLPRKFF